MKEKELNLEITKNQRLNEIITKLLTNRRIIITFVLIIVLTIIEFTTDFAEIMIGNAIELTNPYRPKSGTIWELHKKDRLANEQLEEITKALPDRKQEIPEINDLLQLKIKLEEQGTLQITADQFRNLYNQIPTRISGDIITPLDLLKLSHSKKWIWTKIVKSDSSLSFYFLDGDKQLLMDTYPSLSVLYTIPEAEQLHQVSLDSMMIYKGRTISAEMFFLVFDDLPNSIKLRLINNPFQLVKWDRNIQKVGISRYINDNVVTIGFQVNEGIYTEIYTFQASDFAVDYFIEKLNELFPELSLDYPEEKYSAFPDYF